jgi:hypothetical protein
MKTLVSQVFASSGTFSGIFEQLQPVPIHRINEQNGYQLISW